MEIIKTVCDQCGVKIRPDWPRLKIDVTAHKSDGVSDVLELFEMSIDVCSVECGNNWMDENRSFLTEGLIEKPIDKK